MSYQCVKTDCYYGLTVGFTFALCESCEHNGMVTCQDQALLCRLCRLVPEEYVTFVPLKL